jgi:hypothetical protein
MKQALAAVRFYSPKERRAEKARQRRRDHDLAAAGLGHELQRRNRLISNPKDWRLEVPDELPNE